MKSTTKANLFRLITTVLILATIAGLIAYDFLAVAEGGTQATISQVTLVFLWAHPAVAIAVGGLLGHLTWPRPLSLTHTRQAVQIIASLAAIVALDLGSALPPMPPLFPLLFGLPVGHFLWNQNTRVTDPRLVPDDALPITFTEERVLRVQARMAVATGEPVALVEGGVVPANGRRVMGYALETRKPGTSVAVHFISRQL